MHGSRYYLAGAYFQQLQYVYLLPIKLNFSEGGGGVVLNTTRKRPCLQHTSIHAAITIEAFNTSLLSPHLYIYCDTCTSLTSDPTLAIILKSLNVYSLHSEIPPIYI